MPAAPAVSLVPARPEGYPVVARGRLRRRTPTKSGPWRLRSTAESEIIALCPSCKALEVMHFSGSLLIPTRKFAQKPDGVYHSCGAGIPCRLFRSGTRPPAIAQRPLGAHTLRTRPTRRAVTAGA